MPNCHKNKGGCQKDNNDCNWGNEICKIKHKLCEIKKCLSCECSTPIFNKDLPLVITQPGCYCIAEDLVFNPTFSDFSPPNAGAVQAAITIQSSNVQLNFGCHTLKQFLDPANPSAQVPFVIGVLVPDMAPNDTNTDPIVPGSLQSIYITGDTGIIQDFSMYGVRIFAHTYDIRLSNLTIKNCAALASRALRPTVYGFEYLPHSFTLLPAFGPSFGVGGLVIGESTDLGMGPFFFTDVPTTGINNVNRVGEVYLENVSCLNNFLTGLGGPCMTNVTINNCHFDDTWSDDPGRSTAPAYNIPALRGATFAVGGLLAGGANGNIDPSCLNMTISNSTFNRTTLRGDRTTPWVNYFFSVSGVGDTRSRNVTFTNCQLNGTTSTFNGIIPGGTTCNFLAGGLEDYTFVDCHFDDLSAIGSVNGVHISGTTGNQPTKSAVNVRFINCSANNISMRGDLALPAPTPSTRSIQGFNLSFDRNCVVDNCVSQNLINTGPSLFTTFNAGFAPNSSTNNAANQADNLVYRNCVTSRVLALNGGEAWGFNMFTSAGNISPGVTYENCISSGNQTIFPPSFPAYSALTNYAVGNLVSFISAPNTLPVNYVALQANGPATAVVTPGTNAAVWGVSVGSVTNNWDPAIPYVIGNIVIYNAGAYVAIANNTGVPPINAVGVLAAQWQTSIINLTPNTWNSAISYPVNSIVSFNGVNYVRTNTPDVVPRPTPLAGLSTAPPLWSLAVPIQQGAGIGFYTQTVNSLSSSPTAFINCVAQNNKGLDAVNVGGVIRYSSGFNVSSGAGHVFDDCKAESNIYGFILNPVLIANVQQPCVRCAVRNCQADNNVNTVTNVGEGFTDMGNVASISTASPGVSTSLFQHNTAFANGAGGPNHSGPNANYNVFYGPGQTIPAPRLEVKQSTGATNAVPGPYIPEYYNISTIL